MQSAKAKRKEEMETRFCKTAEKHTSTSDSPMAQAHVATGQAALATGIGSLDVDEQNQIFSAEMMKTRLQSIKVGY